MGKMIDNQAITDNSNLNGKKYLNKGKKIAWY
jgi:hypothetical protein